MMLGLLMYHFNLLDMRTIVLQIFFLLPIMLIAQERELVIIDMDNDKDVVLEISTPNTTIHEERKLRIGINESNDGWLRTMTNHNLTLWTDNKKRMVFDTLGRVSIGNFVPQTNLHINQGGLMLENANYNNQLNIYKGASSYRGGISTYQTSQFFSGLINILNVTDINCQDCNTNIMSNDNVSLIAGSAGGIWIQNLSSVDSVVRKLSVAPDGKLSAPSLSEEKHAFFGTNLWDKSTGRTGPGVGFCTECFVDNGNDLRVNDQLLLGETVATFSIKPRLDPTVVYIKEIEVFYADNDDDQNLEIRLSIFSDEDIAVESSEGLTSSPNTRVFNIPVDRVIDQERFESLFIKSGGGITSEKIFIRGAKITYVPM